ncbi:AraC family transcriptional regulator ligand-binding domain-containing protein [Litoribacillus peritrichatus]
MTQSFHEQPFHKKTSQNTTSTVSAVALVDLASELLSLNVINLDDISLISPALQKLMEQNRNLTPEDRFDEKALIDLWRSTKQSNDKQIGLKIGQKVNKHAKGVLAHLLSHCNTLNEAFDTFTSLIALLNPSELWVKKEHDQLVTLEFCFQSNHDYPHQAVERSVCALLHWAEFFVDKKITPMAVTFRHDEPQNTQAYLDAFNTKVQFGAQANSLVLSSAVMTLPIKTANAYLKEVLSSRAHHILESLKVPAFTQEAAPLKQAVTITDKVLTLFKEDLSTFHQTEQICSRLHLSRVTLYRKLKAEGTTFRTLLNQVRKELAEHELKKNTPVIELCEQLGFKDPSTFYKAQKHWK